MCERERVCVCVCVCVFTRVLVSLVEVKALDVSVVLLKCKHPKPVN